MSVEAQGWGLGAEAGRAKLPDWDEGQAQAVVVMLFPKPTAAEASPHSHSRARGPGQELRPQRAQWLPSLLGPQRR